jgi:Domain of unknown function (DUF4405)
VANGLAKAELASKVVPMMRKRMRFMRCLQSGIYRRRQEPGNNVAVAGPWKAKAAPMRLMTMPSNVRSSGPDIGYHPPMTARSIEPPADRTEPKRPAASVRNDIGPISNALLYLVFCVLAATGLAMTFRLDDRGSAILGLGKQDWARVHAIAALSVLSLVVLHLWVNWRWIRSILARLRWPTVLVALVGLAMLVLALAAPVR